MIVDAEIFKSWQEKYRHGDGARIAEFGNVHVDTIRPALRTGEMTQSTCNIITAFYNQQKPITDNEQQ